MSKNVAVKVWNRNTYEYRERFKGQEVVIPPNSFVVMNQFEAVEFKSTFVNPRFLKGGVPDPRYYKMIVIEPMEDKARDGTAEEKEPESLVCQKCGFEAKSKQGLRAHIKANHIQAMENDDERRKIIAEE